MPTGYTADIKDGISFEQFTLNCARAFGALLPMRDLPNSAEIPERFEASPYHLGKLTEARNILRWYEGFSEDEARMGAANEYEQEEHNRKRRLCENQNVLECYRGMLRQVQAWEPPSADHVKLKTFMVKQIEESIKRDDSTEYLSKPTAQLSPTEWLESKKAKALQDIEYHKAQWAEEVQRTEQRNRWLKQLRGSLK